jgi:ATP:ADP antiporter, AAA family
MAASSNPLKQILNIRREEWPQALLMFGYFFLVITTFWILKPIKKGIFIGFYDQSGFDLWGWHMGAAQAELLAKVLNMVVAAVAVTVFTLLVRRFQRQNLTYVFSAFFVVSYLVYGVLLANPSDWTAWSFYLFGDLYSTLMVATFFAFLNDSVAPAAAKRLYGLIGLGGVTGGAFGTTAVRAQIEVLSNTQWMWICVVIAGLIAFLAFLAGRRLDASVPTPTKTAAPAVETPAGNPALEGARLVFRSRYLLSIVAIVGLYEMVSTIMDFQFTSTIVHYLDGPEIGRQFSTVFALTNWVALFVQLFLTSFVMTRFGVGTALLFLPVAALAGSAGFMIFPVLWVGSLLNTTDNGFSYSINQSAKEVLYVPTSREEKYKAKAFIDMFVQRFAKALAVGLSLVITTLFTGFSSIRWLSLLTVGILVLWIMAARYAGRVYNEKERENEKESAA